MSNCQFIWSHQHRCSVLGCSTNDHIYSCMDYMMIYRKLINPVKMLLGLTSLTLEYYKRKRLLSKLNAKRITIFSVKVHFSVLGWWGGDVPTKSETKPTPLSRTNAHQHNSMMTLYEKRRRDLLPPRASLKPVIYFAPVVV